jgi:hypothetical protein
MGFRRRTAADASRIEFTQDAGARCCK